MTTLNSGDQDDPGCSIRTQGIPLGLLGERATRSVVSGTACHGGELRSVRHAVEVMCFDASLWGLLDVMTFSLSDSSQKPQKESTYFFLLGLTCAFLVKLI